MVRFALAVDAVSVPVISLGVPWQDRVSVVPGLSAAPNSPDFDSENHSPNSPPVDSETHSPDSPDLDSETHSSDTLSPETLSPDCLSPDTLEADRLEELAYEITSLSSQIEATTYRLLTLLADFDSRRGWEREGHRSCAHWLSYRTGIDLGASRERVRAARALVELPQIGAAMERGELSFSKVRALTRVATPEDEGRRCAGR